MNFFFLFLLNNSINQALEKHWVDINLLSSNKHLTLNLLRFMSGNVNNDKTEFRPPSENYMAGLARGAVGFITKNDIGQ